MKKSKKIIILALVGIVLVGLVVGLVVWRATGGGKEGKVVKFYQRVPLNGGMVSSYITVDLDSGPKVEVLLPDDQKVWDEMMMAAKYGRETVKVKVKGSGDSWKLAGDYEKQEQARIQEEAKKKEQAKTKQEQAKDLGGKLIEAAKFNNVEEMQKLLDEGADVNAKDHHGARALHWATSIEALVLLFQNRADVNAKDDDGLTPLHWAAHTVRVENVKLLLSKGADVNARSIGGETPLHWAAKEGQTEVASFLLDKGADVNAKNIYGDTPLHLADDTETVVLLRQRGGVE